MHCEFIITFVLSFNILMIYEYDKMIENIKCETMLSRVAPLTSVPPLSLSYYKYKNRTKDFQWHIFTGQQSARVVFGEPAGQRGLDDHKTLPDNFLETTCRSEHRTWSFTVLFWAVAYQRNGIFIQMSSFGKFQVKMKNFTLSRIYLKSFEGEILKICCHKKGILNRALSWRQQIM